MPSTAHRRPRSWPPRAAAVLALLATLAGCGGARHLDLADARSLQASLTSVRRDATQGDRQAALADLAALRAHVDRLRASGALDASDALALRADVDRALAAARRELAPPPAAVAPPALEPPEPPPDRGRGHEHKRHDAGHGDKRKHGGDATGGGGGD